MSEQRVVTVSRAHGLALFIARSTRNERDKIHALAEAFCDREECGARACLSTNPAWKQVISQTSLQRRLQKEVVTGKEHAMTALLTKTEDLEMAASLEAAGKQSACFDLDERNRMVVDILLFRQAKNKKGGRAFRKLSKAAFTAIRKGKAGRKFWKRFFARHSDKLYITKEKVTSIQRLKQCTEEIALQHCLALKHFLAGKGIYDLDADRFVEGKEANIIALDEMGQFFNFLLRKGTSANVVGAKGVPAKSGEAENRQQFTYDGALGGDMFLYDMHLIFRAAYFSADMAPTVIAKQKFCMISVTDKGCQIGSTFLARLKLLVKQARARGITGDIVFLTDGHASRFFTELLRWLDNSATEDVSCITGHDIFLTPPNATGTCSILDQIFQSLHRVYGKVTTALKKGASLSLPVGRFEAISTMVHIHDDWCSYKEKMRAWRHCGIDMGRLDGNGAPASVDLSISIFRSTI